MQVECAFASSGLKEDPICFVAFPFKVMRKKTMTHRRQDESSSCAKVKRLLVACSAFSTDFSFALCVQFFGRVRKTHFLCYFARRCGLLVFFSTDICLIRRNFSTIPAQLYDSASRKTLSLKQKSQNSGESSLETFLSGIAFRLLLPGKTREIQNLP